MKIIETIFDSCYLIEPEQRENARGTMSVFFNRDEVAGGGASGIINYKDPEINLQLPVDDSEIIISDYDKNAGMEMGK